MMEAAFTGIPIVARSSYCGGKLATTSLTGRPLSVKPLRRAYTYRTVCVSVAEEQRKKHKSKDGEEEEVLDEAAMRAAEIHEVLVGLRDFKERIINGKFSIRRLRSESFMNSMPALLEIARRHFSGAPFCDCVLLN